MMNGRHYASSESESSETSSNNQNTYCIFLHIVEGIGFNIKDGVTDLAEHRRNRIVLNVSLNGVKFEVEGHSLSNETATIFNSNCIWECDLCDIKRMKTDNRPVKLECFQKTRKSSETSPRRCIGNLLLPIRGVQIYSSLSNAALKLHWHKLSGLSSEWRANKPEIYLMLIILKKSVLESGQLEAFLGRRKSNRQSAPGSRCEALHSPSSSDTALMLQSQHNVYVQLLEQVGLIQVGNNPDEDCDIMSVTLTFKRMKNFTMLLQTDPSNGGGMADHHQHDNVFIFHYDFLGSNSYVEVQMTPDDSYTINEKISLTFKTSLSSLRMYFQRIFYVPVNIYYQGAIIANYRFDFSRLLPEDDYFLFNHPNWMKKGSFTFQRLHKIESPLDDNNKPSVDYIFSVQMLSVLPCGGRKSNHQKEDGEMPLMPKRDNVPLSPNMVESFGSSQVFKKTTTSKTKESQQLSERGRLAWMDKYQKEHLDAFIRSNGELMEDCYAPRYLVDEEKDRNDGGLQPQTANVPNTTSVGTNTESVSVEEEENIGPNQDDLCLKAVQELEAWKQQQMECFLTELARKEQKHLDEMKQTWLAKRSELEARLETKLTKCERLNEELERANAELRLEKGRGDRLRVAENMKREFEESYVKRFLELDGEVKRLKVDMQRHENVFELKSQQIHVENERLHKEKMALKEHIEQLEKKFSALENTQLPADELKEVLSDLRLQNNQFMAMEKSRDYYKDQWWKASQQVQKLNTKLLRMQELEYCRKGGVNCVTYNLELDDILNEEHEMLKSDRQELSSVKEVLFNITDSSSEDGGEAAKLNNRKSSK